MDISVAPVGGLISSSVAHPGMNRGVRADQRRMPTGGVVRTEGSGVSRGVGRRTVVCCPVRTPGALRACRGWRTASSRPMPARTPGALCWPPPCPIRMRAGYRPQHTGNLFEGEEPFEDAVGRRLGGEAPIGLSGTGPDSGPVPHGDLPKWTRYGPPVPPGAEPGRTGGLGGAEKSLTWSTPGASSAPCTSESCGSACWTSGSPGFCTTP